MEQKTDIKTLPKTHWKKLYNPNYLGAWSIEQGKDLILTIKTLAHQMVTGSGGKTEECTVIEWVQSAKPMILNKTNAKMITKVMDSPYIEDWANRSIQLYVAKVQAYGEVIDAIRIRPTNPNRKKTDLTPEHESWGKAQAAIYAGNTTIEAIRKKYNLSETHAKILKDAKVA